jgi:hypothetical protein
MKTLNQLLFIGGATCALTLLSTTLLAQDAPPLAPTAPADNSAATTAATPAAPAATTTGSDQGQNRPNRRNFDPAQMQQRIMERYKEVLEVNSDDEWAAIQPLVQKVMDARRDAGGFNGMRMFGRGNRNGGDTNNGQTQRPNPFAPTPMPEQEALQKAIDAKASDADMKAALAKYVEARKAKQAGLAKAQDDLRAVLTVRQEAIASLNGLL